MAATSFNDSLASILLHEGGFVEHPADPGGATKYGVTRRTLARSRGRSVSVDDVRGLTREEAGDIYRRLYWDGVRADDLPAGIDHAVFDFAVNSGSARAVRMLQEILGIEPDGIVGPATLAAAHAADRADVVRRLTRARLAFLSRLASWLIFGRGWRRRVLAVEQEALRLGRSFSPRHHKEI